MTQAEVKAYMEEYLKSREYEVYNEDGFLYAEGDVPVLLVAHMDTVHKTLPTSIFDIDGKISSHQGIGGDDRCGIFIIMNIIKNLHCSVLLCEDEEIGGVGARKFIKTPFIKELDINYIIEFDRMNAKDAVFYSCDNPEFTKFVTDATGFKVALGSFSDISVIAPVAKIAAVNLSCGYYNAHSTAEYVVYDEMMNTVRAAEKLIKTECNGFEYVPRKQMSIWDYDYPKSYTNTSKLPRATKNLEIELEVVFIHDNEEEVGYGIGQTKAEAWLNFFESYDDVCYAQVVDYSFC
jgi:putative aminopeptidase FrvX